MADTLEYIVKGDMRWDAISYTVYGTPNEVGRITAANPDVPVTPIVESGTLLQIPIITVAEAVLTNEQLPIWKQ